MDQKTLKSALHYNPDTGQFTWIVDASRNIKSGQLAGSRHAKGYWQIYYKGKHYLAHRLAWLYVHGQLPKSNIDHINMDGMDNRISNLRIAGWSENACNTRAKRSNKLGVKGVHKIPSGYTAQIQYKGKKTFLGTFQTVEEAGDAYRQAAINIHGSFAPN